MVVVVIFGVVVVVADAEVEAAAVVVSLSSGVGCSPHAVTLAAIASAAARAAKRLNFFMMNVLSFLPLIVRQNVMGTSKKRFEKGKRVEHAECEESLTRRFEEAGGVLYTFSLKRGF